MFTPRFDAVRELEEWISTIQFNYVGSSPQKSGTSAVQVYELSNREDKAKQFTLPKDEYTPSMSEQIVEILVKVFQTGMRPGLRGALEVIKVLDRVPETVYVPVPSTSFSASQLEKSSRWFRSEEEYKEYFDINAGKSQQNHVNPADDIMIKQNNNFFMPVTNPKNFDLVPVSMKFIRSALFVVNSAAASALSPVRTATTKPSTTASAKNSNKKTISDSNVNFLATATKDNEQQQQQNDQEDQEDSTPTNPLGPKTAGAQLRMFIRLCLQQRCLLAVVELLMGFLKSNTDVGALAEFLYVHSSASPLIDDLAFPQVMDAIRKFGGPPLVVRAAAAQCRLSIGPLLESPWNPEVAIANSEDGESSPLTASWSMWFASKGLRLRWNLEFNLPNDNTFPDYILVEASSGLTSLNMKSPVSGSISNRNNNNNVMMNNDFDAETGSIAGRTEGGGKRIVRKIIKKKAGPGGTTTTKTVIVSPGGAAGGTSVTGESPRPKNSVVVSPQATSIQQQQKSSGSTTPVVSGRKQHVDEAKNTDSPPPDLTWSDTAAPLEKIPREPFTFTTQEETDSIIHDINTKKQEQVDFVNSTISRWKNDVDPVFQSGIAESVHPLLEAYATLVFVKWSTALGKASLSENRLMECEDVDAGVDENNNNNDRDDNDVDSEDEFDLDKKPIVQAMVQKQSGLEW
jgi:hypothetical protein